LVSKEIEVLSRWLSNNGLNFGYGPYWSSSIVTATTREQVKVRALLSDGAGKLKPFEFAAAKRWYEHEGNSKAIFVLTRDEEISYSEADVIRTFGEPRDKSQVGPYIVNVYDSTNDRIRSFPLPPTNVN